MPRSQFSNSTLRFVTFDQEKSFDIIFKSIELCFQENCFLECRARILLKECGCLPYYYPRLDAILQFQEGFENLTAACTLDGWKCLMSNVDILEAVDPMSHNTGDNVEVQKLTGAKYVSIVRPSLFVNKTV